MPDSPPQFDLETLRQRAISPDGSGPRLWRSLNELAATPEFQEYVQREFPQQASEWHDPVSRRNFLKLMSASLALAGVFGAGCAHPQPEEKIVPYVHPPEYMLAGKPMYFATAMPFNGYGLGLLVESYMFRPIKVEGNPRHPASLGATNPFAQASILTLYDPERSQAIREAGEVGVSWSTFVLELERFIARRGGRDGGRSLRVRVLTETVTSPTLAAQIRAVLERFPAARWHHYQPVSYDNALAGTRMAFGRPLNTVYRFDRAKRIVSLDANFLLEEPGSVRYARDFIDGRRIRADKDADGKKAGEVWRERAGVEAGGQAETGQGPDEPGKAGQPAARPGQQGGAGHQTETLTFTEAERGTDPALLMNRLYVLESTHTITGAMADNRLAVRPSEIALFARALAARLGVPGAGESPAGLSPQLARWADEVAKDLQAEDVRGRALVIPGHSQPPAVHALAHAINAHLGGAGQTVVYTEPVEADPNAAAAAPADADQPAAGDGGGVGAGGPHQIGGIESLRALVDDMRAGVVDALFIVGGNPVYNAPADIPFREALETLAGRGDDSLTCHLSLYYDETSFRCRWHIPQAHYLESWGDVRAYDGTATVIQPLINPLYNGRTAYELLAALNDEPDLTTYDAVRRHWRQVFEGNSQGGGTQRGGTQGGGFEDFWLTALHEGMIPGTGFEPVNVTAVGDLRLPAPPAPSTGLELVIRPDPTVWDGQFAPNAWLQELPKPLTKITWDNVVHISPNTAKSLNLSPYYKDQGPVVVLRYRKQTIQGAVWVTPGHPDGVVTIHLGYGRTHGSRLFGGEETGRIDFSAYQMMFADAPTFGPGAQLTTTGETRNLACTQDHQLLDEPNDTGRRRDLVRRWDIEPFVNEITHKPDQQNVGAERGHGETVHLSLYPEYDYSKGHAWGMVIDQNACIGCNTCVIACQAENNIPVIGKEEVYKGREMHWLRIDTYRGGPLDAPETYFQPMLCQHCEKAPCEVVCPVAATTHSNEGINEMTYNRCVGTRYCSNNCPYKVRRFNFLQYNDNAVPVMKLLRNPYVTVRNRGVMEKCTYCVQRVNQTRIELKKVQVNITESKDSQQQEGYRREEAQLMEELQTACQQACPTEAIVFGDLNYRPGGRGMTEVARLKHQPEELHYGLLTELNTQPRTTYLARFRNANANLLPEGLKRYNPSIRGLEEAGHGGGGHGGAPAPAGPDRAKHEPTGGRGGKH